MKCGHCGHDLEEIRMNIYECPNCGYSFNDETMKFYPHPSILSLTKMMFPKDVRRAVDHIRIVQLVVRCLMTEQTNRLSDALFS